MRIQKLLPLLMLFVTIFACHSASAQYYTNHTTKNDIKFTILSLGSGSARFTYERAFTPKYSAEFTIGVIGWGWDFIHHLDSRGVLLKGAFKWNLIPMKKANSWLSGFYVKPELVASIFNYAGKNEYDHGRPEYRHTSQFALLGECGYQLILKWFVFDVYAGMGFGAGTGNDYNYYHSFMHLPKNWPVVYTSGFRVGVAF